MLPSEITSKVRSLVQENPGIGRYEIARRLGIGENAARTALREMRKSADGTPAQPAAEPERIERTDDSIKVSLPATRIHTLEQLIAYCEVDQDVWEVERFVCNKWEVGSKSEDGIVVEPLYQVKAWLKRRKDVSDAVAIIERLEARAAAFAPVYPQLIFRDRRHSGNMLEIALTDHHFGKLAWSKETGWEDYDLRIADRSYRDGFTAIIDRTRSYSPDAITIVVGSDQNHSDNKQGTTTGGTPQDMDSRYFKVCDTSADASIWSIEAALTVAPKVRVVVVPGNHDFTTSWHLGRTLAAWFRNCPNVEVDSRPLMRKYIEHGCVMLCWTHGNDIRWDGLPLLMAQEQPQMWGRTKWKEVHTGDKHQRKLKLEEFNGVAVRILPSLCPPDAWHSSKGFVGNLRVGEAYVWNESEGLVGTAVYSILPNQGAA